MKEKWMDRLDLPEESMPHQTVVEIVGYDRVLIEHHGGVCRYDPCQICVKVKFGVVQVTGKDLILKRMSRHQLIITGCISAVGLERRTKR